MVTFPACALYDPGAPDRVKAFKSRAEPYQKRIREEAQTTQDFVEAYADYEAFLLKEMQSALKKLKGRMEDESVEKLEQAQKRWMTFREAEKSFLRTNWSLENFGTSAVMSRGGYRTLLLKQRVITLLHYLNNYK